MRPTNEPEPYEECPWCGKLLLAYVGNYRFDASGRIHVCDDRRDEADDDFELSLYEGP